MELRIVGDFKDFFGRNAFQDYSIYYADSDDAKKAFNHLRREYNFAVQPKNFNFTWDTLQDYENGVMSVSWWPRPNICETVKMSTSKAIKFGLFLFTAYPEEIAETAKSIFCRYKEVKIA